MRNRRDVLDHCHFEPYGLKRPYSGFPSGAGAFYINLDGFEAMLHAAFAAVSAADCAANGVDFLEPLKPSAPELDWDSAFP